MWTKILEEIDNNIASFNEIEQNIGNGIILFGAGQYGKTSLEYLMENNYEVSCFIDNSTEKQAESIKDIKIFSSNKIIDKGIVLITAHHAVKEIEATYKAKVPFMSFDRWFAIKNIKKYEYIRENFLTDDCSKNVIDNIVMAMLTGDEKYCSKVFVDDQYFCLPQFKNFGNEIFLDAGAFVGDTVEKFIWKHSGNFKQIYAFEPGKKQFLALNKRVERLISEWALDDNDILTLNAGIANMNSKMNVNDSNKLQSITLSEDINSLENEKCIDVFSIDEYFKNIHLTFIKADIEGFEQKLLQGATNTILKYKPKMALCTYHGANDLFYFIEFIKKNVPEYKFSLRHHSYSYLETVLYCWVE